MSLPASNSALRAPSVATAMAMGASAMNDPLDVRDASSTSVCRSRTTMMCHGWLFLLLGAHRPALRILSMTPSGTGSGLKFLTASRVRMVW